MYRLIPVFATGLILSIAWFDLGAEYNVPALYWAEHWYSQTLIGFTASLLFGYVWMLSGILRERLGGDAAPPETGWSDSPGRWLLFVVTVLAVAVVPNANLINRVFAVLLATPILVVWLVAPARWGEALQRLVPNFTGDWWKPIRRYLGKTWIPLCLLLAIPATFNLPTDYSRLAMLPGIALGFAPTWALWLLLRWVNRKRVAAARDVWVVRPTSLEWFARILFGALLVIFIGLSYVPRRDWVSPAVSVSAVLGLIAGLVAAAHYYCKQWTPIFGAVVAVIYVAFNVNPYKIYFPNMAAEYVAPLTLTDDDEPEASLLAVEDQPSNTDRSEHDRVIRLCARLNQRLDPRTIQEWEKILNDRKLNSASLLAEFNRLNAEMEKREQQRLDAWAKYVASKTNVELPKMVIVATTGGANRSALWTAVVMDQLEREFRTKVPMKDGHFPMHVRVITGASGGMVGAAHFVARLSENGHEADFDPKSIADDYLTPIINTAAFREVPRLFSPFSYELDRGHALDWAMEKTTGELGRSFLDLEPGENAGWRPSLIFTPMIVDDGRRLVVSNLNLPFLTVSDGSLLMGDRPPPERTVPTTMQRAAQFFQKREDKLRDRSVPNPSTLMRPNQREKGKDDVMSRSAIEMFRLFPDARSRFHVSTAARMNASFPWASPAVNLPTNPPRRVADAGYYDNYGVNVAARWIAHNKDWLAAHTGGVVLIQIRDGLSEDLRRHLYLDENDPSWLSKKIGLSLEWATSPLTGAVSSRDAVASFRNDEQLEVVNSLFPDQATTKGDNFFTTVIFERPGDVAMNWYLTEEDKAEIASVFRDKTEYGERNRSALRRLLKWW